MKMENKSSRMIKAHLVDHNCTPLFGSSPASHVNPTTTHTHYTPHNKGKNEKTP